MGGRVNAGVGRAGDVTVVPRRSCRHPGSGAGAVSWQWLYQPQLTHFLSRPKLCVAQQPWKRHGVAGRGSGRELCWAAPCGSFGSASTGLVSAGTALLGPSCCAAAAAGTEPCCPGCSQTRPRSTGVPLVSKLLSVVICWFGFFDACFVVNEIWAPLMVQQNHLCHLLSLHR